VVHDFEPGFDTYTEKPGYRGVHVSFCFFLLSLCGFWGDG